MAKSKSGGTRTYIRGRVGSDVYSIGRDSKGKKQQVVRSLAESVSNPQTSAQMKGRMILSTIAQALAVLRPIVDHSFDNVVGAQANLSEFTSRNYALIKADIAAHPASGNKFGLVSYQEKGAKRGCYVISAGSAVVPAALSLDKASGVITITLASDNLTIGGLKSVLGMSDEEYFTLVGLTSAGQAMYERFRVAPGMADATALSASNVADAFATEGNAAAVVAMASNQITITLSNIADCCAVIISKKSAGTFIHNKATLGDGADFASPANTALATYPVGAANYLNGGDIFGLSESGAQAGEAPAEPTPRTLTIVKNGSGSATVKDASNQTVNNGGSVNSGTVVTVTITPETGKAASAQIGSQAIALSQSGGNYVGSFNMPDSNSTLTINTAVDNGGGGDDGLDTN